MKIFKIFPAAAGVIALTATVSFARDPRKFEEGDFCRTRIGNCNSTANSVDREKGLIPICKENANGNVYVVEIARGDKIWMVLIDAYTGKVLERRDLGVIEV